MTYQEAVLYCIFIFLTVLSPVMISLTIYGIYISLKFFSGVLIEFNESKILKQDTRSLEEKIEFALSQPLQSEEWYSERDKEFVERYNANG